MRVNEAAQYENKGLYSQQHRQKVAGKTHIYRQAEAVKNEVKVGYVIPNGNEM